MPAHDEYLRAALRGRHEFHFREIRIVTLYALNFLAAVGHKRIAVIKAERLQYELRNELYPHFTLRYP